MLFRNFINGEHSKNFKPSRGLRQGDPPLSLYIFLLCVDGLSSLLKKAEPNGFITRLKIVRTTHSITHLFFADENMLFLKAKTYEFQALHRILKVYKRASSSSSSFSSSINAKILHTSRFSYSHGGIKFFSSRFSSNET